MSIKGLFSLCIIGVLVNCAGKHPTEQVKISGQSSVGVQEFDVLSSYMMVKNALVYSNSDSAVIATIEFKKAIVGAIDPGFEKALLTVSAKLLATGDINEQRKIFEQMSVLIYALADNGEFENYKLYKQFCPIAFDNEGAYWLSLEESILNPYFGDPTHKCGYIEEIL